MKESRHGADERTPLKDGKPHPSGALRNPVVWASSLSQKLPGNLLGSIIITHHLLKGFFAGGGDEGLLGKPVEFLLGAQHVPAARMQALLALGLASPWVLKPMIGFFSDTVPIFGYKKNPLMIIMTAAAIVSVMALGTGLAQSPSLVVLAVFVASLQVAGSTLLVDAKASELAKGRSDLGPDIVTFRETCMNSGMVFSACIAGPLIAATGPRTPYIVALPFVAAPLAVAMCNWLQEERLEVGRRGVDLSTVRRNPYLFALGFSLLPLLVMMGMGSLLHLRPRVMATLAVLAVVTIIGGYAILIRRELAGPIIFWFVLRCANVQLTGALFYFFTNSPEAYPEGPHFSPFFYVTCVTVVAIAGRIIGILTAKDLFSQWTYSKALSLNIPLVTLTQLMLVPLLLRWNHSLGVPDRVWALAWTFVDMVARGWRQFPLSILLLQATPKGLEASSMALNSGAVNMGFTLSSFFAGFILSRFGVEPGGHVGESEAFANLWKAQVVAALLPLITLPLLPMLVPQRRQNEVLVEEEPSSATYRAPVERICLWV